MFHLLKKENDSFFQFNESFINGMVYNSLYPLIDVGNEEAKKMLDLWEKVKPFISYQGSINLESCTKYGLNEIIVSYEHIQSSRGNVVVHELAHLLLNHLINNQKLNYDYIYDTVIQARQFANKNVSAVEKVSSIFDEVRDKVDKEAYSLVLDELKTKYVYDKLINENKHFDGSYANYDEILNKYGNRVHDMIDKASMDDYIHYLTDRYTNINSSGQYEKGPVAFYSLFMKDLNDIGYSKEKISKMNINPFSLTVEQAISIIQNAHYNIIRDKLIEEKYASIEAISDIVDAVLLSGKAYPGGVKIFPLKSHLYYNNNEHDDFVESFHEMVANFTQVKIFGSDKDINILVEVFGKEFVDMLDMVYHKFYTDIDFNQLQARSNYK